MRFRKTCVKLCESRVPLDRSVNDDFASMMGAKHSIALITKYFVAKTLECFCLKVGLTSEGLIGMRGRSPDPISDTIG